ncbi:hypothetical protein K2173_006279 [Erythroxylum novogranatense]|uniref:DUF241 domain protein n=1 Tax=Erythroxylum novogranatense TaxID=1862640 RepID=A0AAV8TEB6_9ROSI|nr:hypothetical protein K2173_006279 [Erythroxylum novogranatense]
MATGYHVRSISLPSRSHPSTTKVEEELNKLRTWEASSTSGSICIDLAGIADLCSSLDDLLNLTSTREVISRHRHEKCLNELLDQYVRLLDICSIARDVTSQFKEQIRALQSAFRRRKRDSCIKSNSDSYTCFRKKMNKEAKKLIASLKHINNKLGVSALSEQHKHFSTTIQMLREANMANTSVLESVLLSLSAPVLKSKQTRWSLVSKLLHKGVISSAEKQGSLDELESLHATLSKGFGFEKMKFMLEKLEALEMQMEAIGNGLEGAFRSLIKTRTSMLNVFSQ